MNRSPVNLVAMLLLCAFSFGASLTRQALAQTTKVAIHATQEEVNIWKQRALSGPYLNDWSRILNRANSFRSNPSGKWLGNQQNQAWDGDLVRDCARLPTVYPGGNSGDCAGNGARTFADGIRDAGFVYLLTGDTSYRNAVLTLLLGQTAEFGTDFTNATRWPLNYVNKDKDFQISLWLRKMTYAYSYIRGSISQSDRNTIDAWFLKAAQWLDVVVHNASKTRFPNRYQDDYSNPASAGSSLGLTHASGYQTYWFGYAWDNKASQHNAAVAAIGALLNDTTLLSHSKRFVKEFLKYNVYADGTVWDQRRWSESTAQSGWAYAATVIGSNITAADHIARTGDTELYTYSTTEGAHGSQGGPKNLLRVMHRLANLTLGNSYAYASSDGTLSSADRIDPDGESPNPVRHYIYDVSLAQANVFYRDNLLKSSYTRPMVADPSNGGYDPWGGDWGNLPGALFMFGQMEGIASPYSGASSSTLTAPANLSITSY